LALLDLRPLGKRRELGEVRVQIGCVPILELCSTEIRWNREQLLRHVALDVRRDQKIGHLVGSNAQGQVVVLRAPTWFNEDHDVERRIASLSLGGVKGNLFVVQNVDTESELEGIPAGQSVEDRRWSDIADPWGPLLIPRDRNLGW
jgi:hypothetical protein